MSKTDWIYVTPSASSIPLQITVQECGRFYFDGDSYTERGSLESFEIALILSDTNFQLKYGGKEYAFGKKGDLFLIDCTRGYRLDTHGYSDLYFIHFWGENVKYYYSIFEKYNASPIINILGLPIAEEFERIIALYKNPTDETADLYAQSIVLQLIQTITQFAMKDYHKAAYSKHMSAAIEYIKDHFSEPLTMDTVAKEINISKSYLALIFKKETGITFSTWLRKYRIGQAKKLLRMTDLSQDDICNEVGIYDNSYMCRLFKEFENVTPDEYRKNWVE